MLNLEVEMASEPVVEKRSLHVAGGMHLKFQPGLCFICFHIHRHMIGLGDPSKPMTVQTPAKLPFFLQHLYKKYFLHLLYASVNDSFDDMLNTSRIERNFAEN